MDESVKGKFKLILRGDLKYTSNNLAANMLISRLKKKMASDPDSFETCIQEIDSFAAKYPGVAKSDYANIMAL